MKDIGKPGGSSSGVDKQNREEYILKDTSCLIFYGRRLYRAAGKLNLYMSNRCQKEVPDKKRIEDELEGIKELIRNIEKELMYL